MKTITIPNFTTKMRLLLFVLLGLSFFDSMAIAEIKSGFICPDDIVLGCCTDYTNTDITGHPASFNQGYSNFSYVDEVNLNECREGYVIRTWKGYIGTTFYTCEQLITMDYVNDFDGNIQWPPNWQGSCGDEIPYLEPFYDRQFCDQIAHTYNDDTLRQVGSVCMKILRNWKVIDWCKYQANTGNNQGIWEYTQVLKIVETSKPEISVCTDWEIKAQNSDCTADAILTKSATDESCNFFATLDWRVEFDLYNDWSVDSIVDKSGDSIQFELSNLPIGVHKVTWKVNDQCGNVQQCMELIHVEDGKPPTPYCYLSMPIVLMPQANMLEVNASMFMKLAKDNCSEEENIIHSWSPNFEDTTRIFDCDDSGFQFLPVFAIDETGNYDFCFIFTRVIDHGNCSGSLNAVEGLISDFSGRPVPGIGIHLGNNPYNIHIVDTTSIDGSYNFPFIETIAEPEMYLSQIGGDYSGLSTLDLVYLMKYLLGLEQPAELDWFLQSADVNLDGQVNVQDLHSMREIILGLSNDQQGSNTPGAIRIFVEKEGEPDNFEEVLSIKDFEHTKQIKILRVGDIDSYFER